MRIKGACASFRAILCLRNDPAFFGFHIEVQMKTVTKPRRVTPIKESRPVMLRLPPPVIERLQAVASERRLTVARMAEEILTREVTE